MLWMRNGEPSAAAPGLFPRRRRSTLDEASLASFLPLSTRQPRRKGRADAIVHAAAGVDPREIGHFCGAGSTRFDSHGAGIARPTRLDQPRRLAEVPVAAKRGEPWAATCCGARSAPEP